MRRRTWAVPAAAVGAALVIGAVVVLPGAGEAESAPPEAPVSTAVVEQGALSATVAQAGILTYRARRDGEPFVAVNQAGGIYTQLPASGARVGCGEPLYRVDADPVVLLCGAQPAYRSLRVGDEGRDVRQLNANLHALGYDADPRATAFGARTEAALRRFQEERGLAVTGTLALADAVFLPRPVRIAEVTGRLGGPARPGTPVAQATTGTLEVQAALEPAQQDAVRPGDRVRVVLPGPTTVDGRVDRLGSVTQAPTPDGSPGAATLPAYIALAHPRRAQGLDHAPVQVEITTRRVEDALSVPVTALVGRAGGGLAVEVVRDGGRRELVEVTLGLFDTAAGRVQVDGELRAGDRVVVPAA